MKNINTYIFVDVANLNKPLPTLKCCQLCAYVVCARNVPTDLTDIYIQVFKTDGQRFTAFPMSRDDNGDWFAEIPASYFPTVGTAKYEVFGSSSFGNRLALGFGSVRIAEFASGNVVVPTGGVIVVDEIPDDDGLMHKLVAVNAGTAAEPDWTMEIRDTI